MLPMRQKIDFDLNGNDEEKDYIEIDTSLDQYGSYNMLSVTVNGKTYTDEINYAYDFDVYLAHIGDKNYIYSDSFSDNDYHMFCTWDINGYDFYSPECHPDYDRYTRQAAYCCCN